MISSFPVFKSRTFVAKMSLDLSVSTPLQDRQHGHDFEGMGSEESERGDGAARLVPGTFQRPRPQRHAGPAQQVQPQLRGVGRRQRNEAFEAQARMRAHSGRRVANTATIET